MVLFEEPTLDGAKESERQFQRRVEKLATEAGWLWYHPNLSKRDKRGFPDLTFVHPVTGDMFFAELKSATGRLSPYQKEWIAALRNAGREVHVWHPVDLPAIIDRLRQCSTV